MNRTATHANALDARRGVPGGPRDVIRRDGRYPVDIARDPATSYEVLRELYSQGWDSFVLKNQNVPPDLIARYVGERGYPDERGYFERGDLDIVIAIAANPNSPAFCLEYASCFIVRRVGSFATEGSRWVSRALASNPSIPRSVLAALITDSAECDLETVYNLESNPATPSAWVEEVHRQQRIVYLDDLPSLETDQSTSLDL